MRSDKPIDDYINCVLEQISWKKAHPAIRAELIGHI